jgi:hypothetical protein
MKQVSKFLISDKGATKQRNFVAKNAKVAGAGRHRSDKDYMRKPKHVKCWEFGQIDG